MCNRHILCNKPKSCRPLSLWYGGCNRLASAKHYKYSLLILEEATHPTDTWQCNILWRLTSMGQKNLPAWGLLFLYLRGQWKCEILKFTSALAGFWSSAIFGKVLARFAWLLSDNCVFSFSRCLFLRSLHSVSVSSVFAWLLSPVNFSV